MPTKDPTKNDKEDQQNNSNSSWLEKLKKAGKKTGKILKELGEGIAAASQGEEATKKLLETKEREHVLAALQKKAQGLKVALENKLKNSQIEKVSLPNFPKPLLTPEALEELSKFSNRGKKEKYQEKTDSYKQYIKNAESILKKISLSNAEQHLTALQEKTQKLNDSLKIVNIGNSVVVPTVINNNPNRFKDKITQFKTNIISQKKYLERLKQAYKSAIKTAKKERQIQQEKFNELQNQLDQQIKNYQLENSKIPILEAIEKNQPIFNIESLNTTTSISEIDTFIGVFNEFIQTIENETKTCEKNSLTLENTLLKNEKQYLTTLQEKTEKLNDGLKAVNENSSVKSPTMFNNNSDHFKGKIAQFKENINNQKKYFERLKQAYKSAIKTAKKERQIQQEKFNELQNQLDQQIKNHQLENSKIPILEAIEKNQLVFNIESLNTTTSTSEIDTFIENFQIIISSYKKNDLLQKLQQYLTRLEEDAEKLKIELKDEPPKPLGINVDYNACKTKFDRELKGLDAKIQQQINYIETLKNALLEKLQKKLETLQKKAKNLKDELLPENKIRIQKFPQPLTSDDLEQLPLFLDKKEKYAAKIDSYETYITYIEKLKINFTDTKQRIEILKTKIKKLNLIDKEIYAGPEPSTENINSVTIGSQIFYIRRLGNFYIRRKQLSITENEKQKENFNQLKIKLKEQLEEHHLEIPQNPTLKEIEKNKLASSKVDIEAKIDIEELKKLTTSTPTSEIITVIDNLKVIMELYKKEIKSYKEETKIYKENNSLLKFAVSENAKQLLIHLKKEVEKLKINLSKDELHKVKLPELGQNNQFPKNTSYFDKELKQFYVKIQQQKDYIKNLQAANLEKEKEKLKGLQKEANLEDKKESSSSESLTFEEKMKQYKKQSTFYQEYINKKEQLKELKQETEELKRHGNLNKDEQPNLKLIKPDYNDCKSEFDKKLKELSVEIQQQKIYREKLKIIIAKKQKRLILLEKKWKNLNEQLQNLQTKKTKNEGNPQSQKPLETLSLNKKIDFYKKEIKKIKETIILFSQIQELQQLKQKAMDLEYETRINFNDSVDAGKNPFYTNSIEINDFSNENNLNKIEVTKIKIELLKNKIETLTTSLIIINNKKYISKVKDAVAKKYDTKNNRKNFKYNPSFLKRFARRKSTRDDMVKFVCSIANQKITEKLSQERKTELLFAALCIVKKAIEKENPTFKSMLHCIVTQLINKSPLVMKTSIEKSQAIINLEAFYNNKEQLGIKKWDIEKAIKEAKENATEELQALQQP